MGAEDLNLDLCTCVKTPISSTLIFLEFWFPHLPSLFTCSHQSYLSLCNQDLHAIYLNSESLYFIGPGYLYKIFWHLKFDISEAQLISRESASNFFFPVKDS